MDAAVKKLRQYAKKKGVRVRFNRRVPLYAAGSYRAVRNVIYLSPKLKGPALVCTLAHELGHALDFLSMKKRIWRMNVMVSGAFNFWYAGRFYIPKKNVRTMRDLIISREELAWDMGEDVLDELGIDVDRKFLKKQRREAVRTYRQLFSQRLR